jgi:hypothetical protein
MKHIMMAVHNNELFVIKDMDAFATLFCYSKKLRYDQVDQIPLERPEDAEMSTYPREMEDAETVDEDDI